MNEGQVVVVSPAEMIKQAVSSNADLDKLKSLLDLQERWEANEAKKAYHRSMADFKALNIEIEKDKLVGYKTDKGHVGYSHATLGNVVRTITKELSKFGLSASWRTNQNGVIGVTCKITHVLGHSEETTLSAPSDNSGSKNAIQAIGSTVTYLQRYTLLSALGLATSDQDDDGVNSEPVLGDKELHIIRDLLIAKELSEANLNKCMGVQKLEDVKMADYMKALAAINSAKKKAVAK